MNLADNDDITMLTMVKFEWALMTRQMLAGVTLNLEIAADLKIWR